ncbi:MAG: Transcriptional regulator, TrmB [Candidatus Taylorbacteria bacterium]|nr:Transcriptional regulator, TrmB [Candidatus Taylorbacteria bacterium]
MSKKSDKIISNIEILKSLEDFGLNETESKIYAALLSTGGGSVSTIAEAAHIKRTTTYSTLDGLIKQGLARFDEFGFKRKIVPEDPQRLKVILEQKQIKLTKTLPTLESMYNLKGNESFIKYYKGFEAVKPIYEKLIQDIGPNEEYFVLSNQKMWHERDPIFFEDFSVRRGRLPIKIKIILEQNDTSQRYFERRKLYNAEIRFLPKDVKLETNLVITPQRTLIHQLVHPIVALIVENNSFIKMHQEMFRIMWNSLPKEEDE